MGVGALLIAEHSGVMPLAHADVLGASILERTGDALAQAGITNLTVIALQPQGTTHFSAKVRYVTSSREELWEDAQKIYEGLTKSCESVLVLRLDCYAEVDWKALLAHHAACTQGVTQAWAGASEPLPIFVVSRGAEKEAEFLFRRELRHPRLAAGRYRVSDGQYLRWLRSAADLRELAVDALNLRCQMRPVGREVRPGIWRADHSRVDADVRLVAPVYIGKHARVRTGAVITRGSSLEHHSSVDCGTVIEDTSLLPFAAVGAGLDLANTVVGGRQVVDLERNVAVEIHDRTLVDELAHNAGVRVLSKAASLASYLPMQFLRGVMGRDPMPKLPSAECSTEFGEAAINEKITRPLKPQLVMERYGNQ